MKRGVSFQISKEYGMIPFEITHYMWKMRGETYFVTGGELDDQEFFKDNSVVEGAVFANHLKTNQYYTIFVELQAYPFGQAVDLVQTYEEFVDSDCELVLLLADSSYVSIYCKDRNVIEKLFINALKNDFEEVQLITDDNDTSQALRIIIL